MSHVEPTLFCVVKILKTILQQPSHAFLISFSRFFFNSTFISTATLSEFSSTFFNMITYISFWLYISIYMVYQKFNQVITRNMTNSSMAVHSGCPCPQFAAVNAPGRCIGDALSILVIQLQIRGASDRSNAVVDTRPIVNDTWFNGW